MRFIPLRTKEQVAAATAKMIIDKIHAAAPTRNKPFILGLSIGSIMARTYLRLVQAYDRGLVSFANVITFNVDEYVGLPKDHPESVHNFMHSNFVDFVDIDPDDVHILNGNAEDTGLECEEFEKKIDSYGGIDLLVGVVGNDGHIAYNEPYSSLTSRTRHKFLAEETRHTRLRYFDHDWEKVPTEALTFGVGTILDSKELLVIGSGIEKAAAVGQAVEGNLNHIWSVASCTQMHKKCTLVVDDECVVELKVKTLRYFEKSSKKFIEQFAGVDRHTQMSVIMNFDVKDYITDNRR